MKHAPEWVRTSDPVIRSLAHYLWTTETAHGRARDVSWPKAIHQSEVMMSWRPNPIHINAIMNTLTTLMQFNNGCYYVHDKMSYIESRQMSNLPFIILCDPQIQTGFSSWSFYTWLKNTVNAQFVNIFQFNNKSNDINSYVYVDWPLAISLLFLDHILLRPMDRLLCRVTMEGDM